MNSIPRFLFPLLIASLLACSSSKREEGDQTALNGKPDGPQSELSRIPPGQCRIVGEIMGIDSLFKESDPASPCAKHPCRARVKIIKVLGYGSAFDKAFSKDEVVDVHFTFTLSPTSSQVFPAIKEQYPGLQVGSRFVANLRGGALGGAGKYVVDSYRMEQ